MISQKVARTRDIEDTKDAKSVIKSQDVMEKLTKVKVEDDFIAPVVILQPKLSKGTKRSSDIEINFSSKQKKISRLSLPASFNSKRPLVNSSSTVSSNKPYTNLQVKKPMPKVPNVSCSIETVKNLAGNITVLNKKLNLNHRPRTILKKKLDIACNAEPVRVSAKKETAFPLNLEQLFKKKRNVPNIVHNVQKSNEHVKMRLVDRKVYVNSKTKKVNKKNTNITCYVKPITSPVINNPVCLDKPNNSTSKTTILGPNYKQEPGPLVKTESLENPTKVLDNKLDLNKKAKINFPTIPSFSVNISSNKNIVNKTDLNSSITPRVQKLTPLTAAQKSKEISMKRKIMTKVNIASSYLNLMDTYRYLIIPKSWSVMEMMTETNEQCIVFFNASIIKENNVYLSIMKKSIVVDTNANMHYSVHGLPVDHSPTILPDILDSTQKLLSILHIFDKMQVCEGVSNSSSNVIQSETIFKDTCRFWRHKDCKIIMRVKSNTETKCSVCAQYFERVSC